MGYLNHENCEVFLHTSGQDCGGDYQLMIPEVEEWLSKTARKAQDVIREDIDRLNAEDRELMRSYFGLGRFCRERKQLLTKKYMTEEALKLAKLAEANPAEYAETSALFYPEAYNNQSIE